MDDIPWVLYQIMIAWKILDDHDKVLHDLPWILGKMLNLGW